MFPRLLPRLARPLSRPFATGAGPSPTPQKDANWPLYLSLFGLTGIAYFVYLQETGQLVDGPYSLMPIKKKKAYIPDLKSALDKDAFLPFTLSHITPYNHNSARYTFALPDGTASLLPVAACVLLRASPPEQLKDDKDKPVVRPYTPISPSNREGELEFLIKKYDNGKMTPFLAGLKPGDKVEIKGPIPKFPYHPNQFRACAMIAGGSGITPMYQLLTHALSLPDDKTHWTLLFANVSSKDILLKEEFDRLEKQHGDRFKAIYVLDKPEESFNGPTGFITKELIKEHVSPASSGKEVKIFVCGPPGQVAAVCGKKDGMKQGPLGGALKELGYDEDQVFKF